MNLYFISFKNKEMSSIVQGKYKLIYTKTDLHFHNTGPLLLCEYPAIYPFSLCK